MITSQHNKIISYLQECYQSDNREEEILDVFDAKMEYCRIIEKKDVLFNGVLSRISLAGEELPELEKKVILQERENQLTNFRRGLGLYLLPTLWIGLPPTFTMSAVKSILCLRRAEPTPTASKGTPNLTNLSIFSSSNPLEIIIFT